jgi:hypothetical protein
MWIAGLAVAGAAIGYGFPKLIKASEEYNRQEWQKQDARERAENTHDGIYVQPHEWEYLQDNGWKILNAEGCNERFTAHGEYMTGDRDVRYIDTYDEQHRQRYTALHAETLQPGTYRLTATGRANGTGAVIFLTDAVQGLKLTARFPSMTIRAATSGRRPVPSATAWSSTGSPCPTTCAASPRSTTAVATDGAALR